MRQLFLLLILSVLLSCDKRDGFVKADLMGFDGTLCACCGGYIFKIDKVDYRATECPDLSFVNETSTYPIQVKIKYERITPGCNSSDNLIAVSEVKER